MKAAAERRTEVSPCTFGTRPAYSRCIQVASRLLSALVLGGVAVARMSAQAPPAPPRRIKLPISERIKGSGMRWDPDNAEAVMTLEALEQSRQWSAYWKLAYLHPN